MTGSTKNKSVKYRRECITELWAKGLRRQHQIAERLKTDYGIEVTRQTVSNDLKAIEKVWEQNTAINHNRYKAEMENHYRQIYLEAMTAWYKSLEDKKTNIQESSEAGGDAGSKAKVSIRTEGQSGNPALLAQAQNALKSIRELYGVDAPQKKEFSWREKVPEGKSANDVKEQFKQLMRQKALEMEGATDDS